MTSWRVWRRWLMGIGVLVMMAATLSQTYAAPPQQSASRTFTETGKTVSSGFLTFFDQHGGLAILGYPITNEILENGKTVQYFQRARLEWHPENASAYRVQLGLVGQEIHGQATPAVTPLRESATLKVRYFTETGHNVTNIFLDYWTRNGGLDSFGFPLGEAFTRDGTTYQWFQRARFEYRNNKLQLGLIGTERYNGNTTTPAPNAPLPADNVRRRQFPETGQTVQGAFLDYFEQKGGVARFGNPLSGEFNENGKSVQYFEYARFEWNPGSPPATRVLLGLLGSELHGVESAVPAFAPPWNSNFRYFSETGHTVSNAFLRYFNANGGVEFFGYPITETYEEGGATIQWFQRRKLLYVNNAVREEALGRTRFNPDQEGRFEPEQIFLLYLTDNASVRDKLGKGLEDAQNPTVAYQPFEGGQMLWRSDTNQICVLYNDGGWQVYANPWRPGDPASANLRPPTNRYEPLLGLGAVWRSIGAQGSKLGWATDEQLDGRGTVQRFQFGTMLYNPVNDRLYVLYANAGWFDRENLYPNFVPEQP